MTDSIMNDEGDEDQKKTHTERKGEEYTVRL